MLYDMEFLTDEIGRRVAAFGYHAGYAGAALAIKAWTYHRHPLEEAMPEVSSYPNQDALITDVREQLQEAKSRVLIIGVLRRCGSGAVDLCKQVGILKWDLHETAKGGPFDEITESNIFINCIYLTSKIPPFITNDSLSSSPNRKLSTICDVSCDPNSTLNPIPIYTEYSTFSNPTVSVSDYKDPALHVISIDHLPSLLPKEASEAFSQALLPSLLSLKDRKNAGVWQQAEELFNSKVAALPDTVKQTSLKATN